MASALLKAPVAMIRWEAPSGTVSCVSCQSGETRVSFEFLTFTRRVCRNCGAVFITVGERSIDLRSLAARVRKSHTRHRAA